MDVRSIIPILWNDMIISRNEQFIFRTIVEVILMYVCSREYKLDEDLDKVTGPTEPLAFSPRLKTTLDG